jgi:hypothetical protein
MKGASAVFHVVDFSIDFGGVVWMRGGGRMGDLRSWMDRTGLGFDGIAVILDRCSKFGRAKYLREGGWFGG